MISFQKVTYHYPADQSQALAPALAEIDLEVPAGQWLLVAGPSGCGKSTLLRCLNGLVPHFHGGRIAGRLRVAGLDPVAVGPRVMSQQVGFLFQDPEAQFVTQRVEDEVALVLENHAVAPQEIGQRLDETFETLRITHLRFRRIATLSGGERQKVALASLWTLRPSLLVLDEPTSQIDPMSAHDIFESLDRLRRLHQVTIVLSEHRLNPLLTKVDRVVLLGDDGRIDRTGTPVEVLMDSPYAPPVLRLANHFHWEPVPLTVAAARQRFAEETGSIRNDSQGSKNVSVPEPAPILEAVSLTYRYPGAPQLAVNGISLRLAPGERCAIVGPNGSGKSTLVKLLVGLLAPEAGRVQFDERDHTDRKLDDIGRDIGLVPQHPSRLLFNDSVAEEIDVTRQARGFTDQAGERDELLAELSLLELADRHPRDLSGGERQRTAVAAVLAGEPRVLLLDEPTRGLDAESEATLAESLRRRTEKGLAVVLVTHDLELVARFADRLVILDQGKKVADGPVGEVMAQFPEFGSVAYRIAGDSTRLTIEALVGDA